MKSFREFTLTQTVSPHRVVYIFATLAFGLTELSCASLAAQNGASVYPAGVDTVLSGLQPAPRKTMIYDYTSLYFANELVGADGRTSTPEFKLRVFADAIKVVRDWNVAFLGGTLHSNLSIPILYATLHVMGAKQSKAGIGNISVAVIGSSYRSRLVHWYYEGDIYLPSPSYTLTDTINTGQHNLAVGPAGAITFLPFGGKTELSSKMQYLVNTTNSQSHYRSGNEFTWEYDAMQAVNNHVSIGVNGAFFDQVTQNRVSGVAVTGSGARARDLSVGPEIGFHVGRLGGAIKYQRDTLVLDHTKGGSLWFQCAFVLNRNAN